MNGMNPMEMFMVQSGMNLGSDMMAGNRGMPNTMQGMNEAIKSMAFLQMMQALSGGGGKATFDSKGMNINMPTEMMSSFIGGGQEGQPQMFEPFKKAPDLSSDVNSNQLMSNFLGGGGSLETSPFPGGTPSLSSIDWSSMPFTGLTPQDYAIGINARLARDKFEAEQAAEGRIDPVELADLMYKMQLTKSSAASEAEARKRTSLLGTDTKDDRPAAIQIYEYAKTEAGGGFTGSYTEFKDAATTTHQKDYEAAKEGGYTGSFNEWLLSMSKAGAINLSFGEKLSQKITEQTELSKLAGQKYFDSPKWTDDVVKYLGSDAVRSKVIHGETSDNEEAIKFIEGKIAGTGGEITDAKWSDDRLYIIWTVTWPTGETQEIKYGISTGTTE